MRADMCGETAIAVGTYDKQYQLVEVDPHVLVLCLNDKVAPLLVKMASADYIVVHGPMLMVHYVLLVARYSVWKHR